MRGHQGDGQASAETADPEGVILWRAGDPWRSLLADIESAGVVTVVTVNGTTHVLDLPAGVRQRIPLEGGHPMAGDFRNHRLFGINSATPCGLTLLSGVTGVHFTTMMWALWAGEVLNWPARPTGRHVTSAILARTRRRDQRRDHPKPR